MRSARAISGLRCDPANVFPLLYIEIRCVLPLKRLVALRDTTNLMELHMKRHNG